jgi:ATP-dependent RNA helicase RhlE
MSFENLGLSAELLRAVADEGYRLPTPVQSLAIPAILDGRDIMARAQTGTGKTAGFALPLLQRLSKESRRPARRAVRTLILTPTRELAVQVRESVKTYGRYLSVRSAVVYGGVGFRPQAEALRSGVEILVATPGRLLDHVGQRTVDLSQVEILVLDEADRMLDMGFIHDIRKILNELPKTRQNLLFSATLSPEIQELARVLLSSPERIEVSDTTNAAADISQVVHPVDRSRKTALLSFLIGSGKFRQVLVFTRTKRGADRLVRELLADGIRAGAIHSDKSQGARLRALADFKRGAFRVLVATDIAARGLDIEELSHVVNFELPHVAEDYVHRIGRTGRAGHKGDAISLVSSDEREQLQAIERLLKRAIPKLVINGFEPGPERNAAPAKERSWGRRPPTRQGRGPAPKWSARGTSRPRRRPQTHRRDRDS